jgi:hypothetical protein
MDASKNVTYLKDEIYSLLADEQNPEFLFAVRNYILGLRRTR